jgi:HEAT repeat protein
MKALPHVLLALAALHFGNAVRAEPVSPDGRPLSAWVGYLRDRESPDAILSQACVVLMKFGPSASPAVPALIERLADEDRNDRAEFVDLLVEIGPAAVGPLAAALSDDSPLRRARAALALGRIGTAAKAAGPALTAALKDPAVEVRVAAAEALWLSAEDAAAVAALADGLAADDRDLRLRCARFLGRMGPAARAAVPALVKSLADRSQSPGPAVPLVAASAAEALGRIGPDARAAAPALRDVLRLPEERDSRGRNTDPFNIRVLRVHAAVALVRLGAETDLALSSLTSVLSFAHHHPGPPALYGTVVAILERHETAVVPWAIRALDEENEGIRAAAVHLFVRFTTVPKEVVPRLRRLARADESLDVRRLALLALVRSGEALDDDGAAVLCRAAQAQGWSPEYRPAEAFNWDREVVRVLSHSETAVPALARLLTVKDETLRKEAAELLAHLGPAAAPARDALRRLVKRQTGRAERWAPEPAWTWAAVALANLDDPTPEIGEALAMALVELEEHDADSTAPPDSATTAEAYRSRLARRTVEASLGHLAPSQRAVLASALVKYLGHYLEHLSQAAADVLVELHRTKAAPVIEPLSDLLRTGGAILRIRAAHVLGRIGPDADAALPALWAMLGDDECRLRLAAAAAVWRIEGTTEGVAAVFRAGLGSESDGDRLATLITIGEFGPAAVSFLPDVVAFWTQDDPTLVSVATAVVFRVAPDAVTALLDLLAHRDRAMRMKAADLLVRFGPAATEPLIRAVGRLDGEARLAAVGALEDSESRARGALPVLRPLLEHRDERLRFAAALAVWRIGRETKGTLPIFLHALRRADVSERRRAAEVLGWMAEAAEGSSPALAQALSDDNEAVRCAAASSLAMVPDGGRALPSLIRLISGDVSKVVRDAALRAVRKLAPDAESSRTVVLALTETLNNGVPDERTQAMEALFELSDVGLPPAAVLVELLDDPRLDSGARRLLYEHRRGALPHLIGALTHPRPAVRQAAAGLLAQLRSYSEVSEAVPELICALQAKDDLRLRAAEALGAIGRGAREAIPALRAACEDGDEALSNAAREALKRIESKAERLPSGY